MNMKCKINFTGSVSETGDTAMTTGSHVASSKPLPADAKSSKDQEQHTAVEKKSVEWGNLFAAVYPLIKIMEVQVCNTIQACECMNSALSCLKIFCC